MKKYTQISLQERDKIFKGLCVGLSYGAIALSLGRNKSSISRECRRNSDKLGYYLYPQQAQELTDKRKAKHGYLVTRTPGLKEYVIMKLNVYWSPVAIAGRWSLENPKRTISKEALYAWIYSKAGIALGLPKLLPQAKSKRGKVRAKKVKTHIPDRVSITHRPETINQRVELGHLEGDLMFNYGSQSSNVLTLVDRKSRFVMLAKNDSKKSDVIIEAMANHVEKYGAASITLDNGSEFTQHSRIVRKFSIPTFFCAPGAPWQKGSVEHMNKMLRRFLPFKMHAKDITRNLLKNVSNVLNNTPRESLGFLTPLEVNRALSVRDVKRESRVKLAWPAMEANFNTKLSSVALHY